MKRKTELIEYLSEKTNTPIEYEKLICVNCVLPNKKLHNRFVILNNRTFKVIKKIKKGGIEILTDGVNEYDINTIFDKVIQKSNRYTFADFGINETQYKRIKNAHKEDERGGWYSMQDIIEIDNLRFIDCF